MRTYKNVGIGTAIVAAVIVVIVILVAAAAVLVLQKASTSTLTTSATVTVTTSAPAVSISTTASSTPISSSGTINIGVISEFTGFAAFYGQDMLSGAQLAATEINAKGGVNGMKINVYAADEGNGGPQTIDAFNQLVLNNNVSYIIGPDYTGDLVTVLPYIAQHHTITISNAVSGLSVFQSALSPQNYSTYKYLFRDYVNDSETGINAIYALNQLIHPKTIAVVGEDYFYAHEITSYINSSASALGIKLATADFFSGSQLDYSAEVLKLVACSRCHYCNNDG